METDNQKSLDTRYTISIDVVYKIIKNSTNIQFFE